MRSRSLRFCTLLLAVVAAACGGSPKSQPTAPTAPTAPTEPAAPAPTAATPSPAAPPAAGNPARPTTAGPNFTPDGVVFNFKAEGKGKQIFLAGNFNGWNPSDAKFLLKDDDGDGMWSITVKLPPGSYQYKYVIDGQWTKDPFSPGEAPDGFGGRNGQFDVK